MSKSPPPLTPPPPLISFFMQDLRDLRDFRGWQLQLRGILPLPPPPQANTLAPPLLVCAVYDVSHLLPQPHPTTFNPTLSHNMYCHVTTNIQQHYYHYHTTPLVSNANNTSTILAKCLTENCANPDNGTQGGPGGGGWGLRHIFFSTEICCGKLLP